MSTVWIGSMEAEDIDEVFHMFVALYQHLNELDFAYLLNTEGLMEYLQLQQKSRFGRILVLKVDGKIAGFAGVSAPLLNKKFLAVGSKHIGILSEIYIQPNYRGKGYAKELLFAVEAFLKERQVSMLQVDAVIQNTAAADLYRRQGFSPSYTGFMKKI